MAPRRPAGPAEAALRLLARRDYTRQEMAARLSGQGLHGRGVGGGHGASAELGLPGRSGRGASGRSKIACSGGRAGGTSWPRNSQRGELRKASIREALQAYPPSAEEEAARAALAGWALTFPVGTKDRTRAWRVPRTSRVRGAHHRADLRLSRPLTPPGKRDRIAVGERTDKAEFLLGFVLSMSIHGGGVINTSHHLAACPLIFGGYGLSVRNHAPDWGGAVAFGAGTRP